MNKSNCTHDKYWFLGFLGFVGFYELPTLMAYFHGQGSAWSLAGLLWFLWFSHFIPKRKRA